MAILPSLSRHISPPPKLRKRRKTSGTANSTDKENDATAHVSLNPMPTLAAVEAGRAKVENHLVYFRQHLSKARRERKSDEPSLSIDNWAALYQSCEHGHGNHFVVHQHNHPVSGVHYDLRLQFSATSSLSFALPKGLPGNPNSRSPGRMAIETRVHNLWNHLIESASLHSGSLLIWDTGTYIILPRKTADRHAPSPQTTDSEPDSDVEDPAFGRLGAVPRKQYENEKLIEAFRSRHIRLRLTGTRLPENYTVTLRLPSATQFGAPLTSSLPSARRRRREKKPRTTSQALSHSTDSENDSAPMISSVDLVEAEQDLDTNDDEDAQTRSANAYPGSTNSIGSVHQRRWFMLLDRPSSGFVRNKGSGNWARRGGDDGDGFAPFLVRGREYEKSVVTNRFAADVESDEGVEGFVGRAGWVGITR